MMSEQIADSINPIIYVCITLITIYLLYEYIFGKNKYSTGKTPFKPNAGHKQDISSLDTTVGNFAMSTFFYVNDWTQNVAEDKPLLTLNDNNPSNNDGCISVELQEMLNNIKISINRDDNEKEIITVSDFPIQKWVNITVSVYGRTLDVYLDGKLVKTEILKTYIPCKFNTLHFGGTPAFDGYLNLGKYIPYAVNPEEAYNLYMDGAQFNVLGNFFEDYKLKVSILQNDNEEASFSI